jgi:hypothetical protein
MKHVPEGAAIEVAPAEAFVVERRGLEGSGFRTIIDVPDGVEHLGTRANVSGNFGAKPLIEETFRCNIRGIFEIRFVSGRPWQTASHTVTTKAICY